MFTWLKIRWNLRKLRSSDPRARSAAVGALERAAGGQAEVPIRAALGDPSAAVRAAAASALGRLGAVAAMPGLIHALTDSDGGVRRAAGEALGAIDPGWPASPHARAAVPELVGRLVSDPASAGPVSGVLRQIRDPQIVPLLLRLFTQEGPTPGPVVLQALGEIEPQWAKAPVAREALQNVLATPQRQGGLARVWLCVLENLDNEDLATVVNVVRRAFDSRDAEAWDAAARALGRMARHAPRDLAHLVRQHPDAVVREAAARVLGQAEAAGAADHPVRDALARALGDGDRFVRYAAASALGSWWDEGTQTLLLEAVRKATDERFKEAAADVLGRTACAEAAEVLREWVRSAWPPLQRAAGRALAQLPGGVAALRQEAKRSFRLQAYYYEAYRQAGGPRGPVAETAEDIDYRFAYKEWRQRIDKLDPGTVAAEIREMVQRGTDLNVVAQIITAKVDLLDKGVDLDDFLRRYFLASSSSVAHRVAESWGLGGFWRFR
jgi:HEAT repeat protein